MKFYIRLKTKGQQPIIKENISFLKSLLKSNNVFADEDGISDTQIWIEVELLPHPISPKTGETIKLITKHERCRSVKNHEIEFRPEQIEKMIIVY